MWRLVFGGCLGGGGGKVRPGPHHRKPVPASPARSPATGLQQRLSLTEVMSTASDQDLSVSLVGSNLHVFTVGELKAATQGFVDSNFLGEGGFGPVYRGAVAEGAKPGLKAQQIAVKLSAIRLASIQFPPVLSWSTRLNIAVGAAKGLAFLHDAEKPVIYRDFKTSNILLDPEYKAKLSDFGLAKDGPEGDDTHVSTRVMGTHGYAAPEYILTGRHSSHS
ncbi:hypothetical protein EJB05_06151, partial [Eragrostis curvula]